MIQQFHEFFESLFGGFFEFGQIVVQQQREMKSIKGKFLSRRVIVTYVCSAFGKNLVITKSYRCRGIVKRAIPTISSLVRTRKMPIQKRWAPQNKQSTSEFWSDIALFWQFFNNLWTCFEWFKPKNISNTATICRNASATEIVDHLLLFQPITKSRPTESTELLCDWLKW